MIPKIIANMLELAPVTVDDYGVIYEQNIVLELVDGSKITVFDPNLEYAQEIGKKWLYTLRLIFQT